MQDGTTFHYIFGMSTNKRDAMVARIIAAGLDLLRREGLLALTQPRVAKAAGIRQSHLTYYFPTRSALIEAIAAAVANGLIAGFDAALAARGPAARAKGFARIGSKEQTRLLLALVLAADREKSVRRLFRAVTKAVRARIAAAMASEGAPAAADAVALFHALCIGLAVLDLARDEPQSRREVETATRAALSQLQKNGRKRR